MTSDHDFPFPVKEIVEGGTSLLVPDSTNIKGPAKKEWGVFFNHAMESNRDLAVLTFAALLPREDPEILDALCASGARGIRYGIEIPLLEPGSQPIIFLNDANPVATRLTNVNTTRLDIRATITQQKAQGLVGWDRYNIIDIDPYGTSVPFLDSALHSISHKGILGTTYTDTAVACGSYARACQRRYQARGLRNHLCHESGLRIIIGHAIRRAAEQDIALYPLLAYYSGHYFRITWRVEKTRSKVGKQLEQMTVGVYDPKKCSVETVPWKPAIPLQAPKGKQLFGPYWNGPLIDPSTLKKIESLSRHPHAQEMGKIEQVRKLLELWAGEVGMPPFFYDTSEISRVTKEDAKPREKLIQRLKEDGFKAVRTHFSPVGIKTNAKWEDITE